MQPIIESKAEKLNSTNYYSWHQTIKANLIANGLYDFCVTFKDYEAKDFDHKKDNQAKYIILSSMKPEEVNKTGLCRTAFDLYHKIKENH